MSKNPRAPASGSGAVLPDVEWIPGELAVEFAQRRLPGDYSREAVSELLSAAMSAEKFLLDRRYGDLEEILLAELMGLPQWHKAEGWLFQRQTLLDWVENQLRDAEADTFQVDRQPTYDEGKQLKTRERDTLMKLIIGMAVSRYKYDPRANRNEATSAIADDLAKLGIPLDPDTVLKWLREAAEYLPREG